MRRLIAGLAATIAVTACGGGTTVTVDGPGLDAVTAMSAAEAADFLAASADVAAEAGSARTSATMSMDMQIPGQGTVAMTMTMDGIQQFDPPRLQMTMNIDLDQDFPGSEFVSGDTELVMIDQVMWMKGGFTQMLGGGWIRMDLAAMGEMSGVDMESLLQQQQQADMSQYLATLTGMTTDGLEQVGVEDVRGEETVHFRGTIDMDAALAQAGPDLAEQLEALEAGLPDTYPIDVWIAGDGLPRRMTFAMSQVQQGTTVDVTMDMHLYDWGTSVDIIEPTGDITDLTDLMQGG